MTNRNQYNDPHEPTNIMECRKGLEGCSYGQSYSNQQYL